MIVETILECLFGREIMDLLMDMLEEMSADFAEDRRRCTDATEILRGTALRPSVDDVMAAIYGQETSSLLFSLCLGLKDNLNHFINPLARTFLEVESETYLREGTIRQLPKYIEAQAIRQRFARALSAEQQTMYEDIVAFWAHLGVLVPKLAHYYGYLLGNELFTCIVPGYYPDMRLTTQYCRMLERDLKMEIQ